MLILTIYYMVLVNICSSWLSGSHLIHPLYIYVVIYIFFLIQKNWGREKFLLMSPRGFELCTWGYKAICSYHWASSSSVYVDMYMCRLYGWKVEEKHFQIIDIF